MCTGLVKPGPRGLENDWKASDVMHRGSDSNIPGASMSLRPDLQLFAACRAGDPDRVIQALNLPGYIGGIDIRDNLRRTPLFYAVDRFDFFIF